MEAASLFMWWGGLSLLVVILCRMASVKLLTRFPLFSLYLGVICSSSMGLMFLLPNTSQPYAVAYWIKEFVTAALSFGMLCEIYNEAFGPYPGIRKLASTVFCILFMAVAARAAVNLWQSPHHTLTAAIVEFEYGLRTLQALLLLALIGLVVHYALPLGRNATYLAVGYAVYLGVRVATLNALFQVGLYNRAWASLLAQVSWNFTAIIWCVGMWVPAATRLPVQSLECDYERTSRQTIAALGQIRNYVVHSWRSS
jgi:hypothetical protein